MSEPIGEVTITFTVSHGRGKPTTLERVLRWATELDMADTRVYACPDHDPDECCDCEGGTMYRFVSAHGDVVRDG